MFVRPINCQHTHSHSHQKATAPIAALAQLHAALDACQFAQFWTLAAAEPARSLVAAVPNFAVAGMRGGTVCAR